MVAPAAGPPQATFSVERGVVMLEVRWLRMTQVH